MILNPEKLKLIDMAVAGRSRMRTADLGGVWNVDGGYTFYALTKYDVAKAVIVDTQFTEATVAEASSYPGLDLVFGNFGDPAIADAIEVDVVFMFDILLHQVNPDWNEILKMYSDKADVFAIFNQQWLGPVTTRLLDMGEKEYFANVYTHGAGCYDNLFQKLEEQCPQANRKWRDTCHIWQWGITDADLVKTMSGLGFDNVYYNDCGKCFDLPLFANHSFLFRRKM
jgi:hypothetical protein